MELAMTKYLLKQIHHLPLLLLPLPAPPKKKQNSVVDESAGAFQAYTNAGVSLNFAVKVCVSGRVPTMATTAV